MSESRHRNQAQNIVEYAWRHRNHNDDIPRQYLTDILVGSIAEALRIAYTTSYAKEYEDEKARRVYYQDIVYDVCNSLDMAAGRSVTKGQGIVCGTKDEPHDSVQKEVKSVVAELTTLRAHVAGLEDDKAHLVTALERLLSAASEQQHTLQSKGWNTEGSDDVSLHWSKAGARRHQWREVDAACIDATDVLQGKRGHGLLAGLEERVRLLNGFIDNVFQLWSFDNDQMHTHTWHTREDLRAEYAKLAASAVKEPA